MCTRSGPLAHSLTPDPIFDPAYRSTRMRYQNVFCNELDRFCRTCENQHHGCSPTAHKCNAAEHYYDDHCAQTDQNGWPVTVLSVHLRLVVLVSLASKSSCASPQEMRLVSQASLLATSPPLQWIVLNFPATVSWNYPKEKANKRSSGLCPFPP